MLHSSKASKHIFYSSLAFAGHDNRTSDGAVMQAHLLTENYLVHLSDSNPSFSYTIVRQGLYS